MTRIYRQRNQGVTRGWEDGKGRVLGEEKGRNYDG